MLLQEYLAREQFQKLVSGNETSAEKELAKAYLAILDIKATAPNASVISQLKARLAEMPDDPVALSRLGEISEQTAAGDSPPADALVLKAIGVRAYQRAEDSRAARYLAESILAGTTNAEAFLYLGLARKQLQQMGEAVDALRTAKALGLK